MHIQNLKLYLSSNLHLDIDKITKHKTNGPEAHRHVF